MTDQDHPPHRAGARWPAWIRRITRRFDSSHASPDTHATGRAETDLLPASDFAGSDSMTLDELLASLLSRLDRLIAYDSASLLLRRPDPPGNLRLAAFRGKPALASSDSLDDLEHTHPVAHELFQERRAVVVLDTRQDTRWTPRAVPDQTRSWMGFPLLHDDQVLGLLSIASYSAGRYAQSDLERLLPYAAQASVAIDRSLISQRLQRRVDEVTALNVMARAITSMLDPDDILHYIMDRAQELFDAEAASIALIDENGQTLTFRVAVGAGADGIVGQQLPIGEGVAGWVARTGQPARVANTRQDERWIADLDRQSGFTTRNIMCAPMIVEDRTIGIVEIVNRRISTFSEDDLQLLSAVSAQVGAAVDRSRLYRRAEHRAAQMTALYDASVDLVGCVHLSDLLQAIATRAAALIEADGSRLYLLEDAPPRQNGVSDHPVLHMHAGAGAGQYADQPDLEIGEEAAGQAIQTDHVVIVDDYPHWARRSPASNPTAPIRCLMAIPLRWRNHIIGALEVLGAGHRGPFSEEDARLLELLGQIASNAIGNAKLLAETSRRAEILAVLLETGQDIASTLDRREVLELIAARAVRLLHADACVVSMLDPIRKTLIPVVSLGDLAGGAPDEDALAGQIASGGMGCIFNARPATTETSSRMGVALRSENETIGVMTVSRRGEQSFSRDDLQFLDSLATQAAIAIVNAELYRSARETAGRLDALQRVAAAINSPLDLNDIMGVVADQIGRLAPHKLALLALYDDATDRFYRPDDTDPLPPWATERMHAAAHSGEPLVTGLPEHLEPEAGMTEPLTSTLTVPVVAEGTTLGAFLLARGPHDEFTTPQVEILAELANHLAIAIDNARLYGERERAFRELQDAQAQLVQTEKLKSLGQMASGIAHNFNNMLAIILGRAQLTMRRAGSDAIRSDLDVILRATRDGAATVRRLQDFTRQKPDETTFSPLDPNEIIQGVAEITQPRWRDQMQAEGRDVQLIVLPAETPRVAGNAAELREVLTNLIFNALDAMPDGGHITLSIGQEEEFVTISVRDSGVGMPEDVRGRVFDPFFTTKGPQNSGLGLSTSYGIIARHGGDMRVESSPGAGTTFTILLPPAEEGLSLERAEEAKASAPSSRILIVDDEVELGNVVQQALQEEGHVAVAFSQSVEALDAFRAEPFDLVITDLGMPVLSGWDLAGAIRQLAADVPIVMITGWGE
jgi:GAF domain-containing protein/anti-sigma regulatory factor (Ser/Thr protein kinase)